MFWYTNDHITPIFVSKAIDEHSLDDTYLRGDNGLNSIKLNVEVRLHEVCLKVIIFFKTLQAGETCLMLFVV